MIKRLGFKLVAIFAAGGAAAAAMVAASFAVYALLKPLIGQPGAAGVVALLFAVIAGLAGAIASAKAGDKPHPHVPAGGAKPGGPAPGSLAAGLMGRGAELFRERPILSTAAVAATALIALRNPLLLATVARAFLVPADPHRR